AASIDAKLEGMGADNFGQIVGKLERVPNLRKFAFSVIAKTKTAGNRNKGQTFTSRTKAGMNASRISRHAIGETRHRAGDAGQPRWRRRTRVLYKFRVLRVLERQLTFTVVGEVKLVHRAVADGPIVGDVPLLETLGKNAAEAGNVRAGQFEKRKGLQGAIVIKVVIDAEVLLVGKPMVDLDGELVAPNGFCGDALDGVPGPRSGDELKQIHSRGVHAGQGNLVVGENTCIRNTVGKGCAPGCRHGRLAAGPVRKQG